jgi:hypothetical protein
MTVARRIQLTRAYLATSAVVGAVLVWFAFANVHHAWGVAVASVAALVALWRWRGVFSRARVVLWLEERMPELRYSLVALAYEPETRFKGELESRVLAANARRPFVMAGARLIGVPAALLLTMQLVVRPLLARTDLLAPTSGRIAVGGRAGARASFNALVTPPAYSGQKVSRVTNPSTIAALVGSELQFDGAVDARATMPTRPTVLRLGRGDGERLVALEPRQDSVPRVVLASPARDTVLARASGVIRLSASARDDIGLTSGWFEMIVSSGDGEAFKFRSGVIARTAADNARELALNADVRLDTLDLKPGDIVHLRAVARDGNPAADADGGSSETRTLRIYRRGEDDSVAVEAAPPPEVGKSELSQRMLIIMTEALVSKMRSLPRVPSKAEATSIAREQARLRKRVGQIIFTRLTGEEDADDAEGALADTLSPMEALLRAADSATGADAGASLEPEEGDAPIVAVNRPLLEAFNAMWEAERKLGVVEPRAALPHMRAALAAIQRARAAERLYLRGRPPKIVLDIAKIRLSGKRDGINPADRSPRASALSASLARQARFHAALEMLGSDSVAVRSAAVDTLTLLRIDALGDAPSLSVALSSAIDDLRSGRDATASLRAARRALNGASRSGPTSRWSGQW